ncbi:MAG: hypothetical protein CVU56_12955 [Deltaproteobacteria bacterium HGW-Deltaproteobacteria-14]|jgi:predicted ArsR family transcriptional regulator|nr:MAG: hypothetical protein CVU56_12955 [Deltaproteobacteria bacterium HGW-Deltaproteobacteria-14]
MIVLNAQRTQLLDAIKREGTVSVDALVGRSDLSKTAVRAHLLTLEELGFIERAEVAGTRVGRPPLAFRVTERARPLFPSVDPELLTRLLGLLGERGHQDVIDAFFEDIWAERRREYAQELAARFGADPTLSERLEVLEAVLDRGHFMPRIEVGDADEADRPGRRRRVVINECNCPFGAAVRATRVPCVLEREFLGEVVGAPPTATKFATSLSSLCVFTFDAGHAPDRAA